MWGPGQEFLKTCRVKQVKSGNPRPIMYLQCQNFPASLYTSFLNSVMKYAHRKNGSSDRELASLAVAESLPGTSHKRVCSAWQFYPLASCLG